MNERVDTVATKCVSTINEFVEAIRPNRYSIGELQGGEFLPAETRLNNGWSEFEKLAESDWMSLRQEMSRSHGMYLWHYAIRMAELAVRRNDDRLIGFALYALIIDDKYTEARDVNSALALVMDAAKRIDADVSSFFLKAASLASPERRQLIESNLESRVNVASMDEILRGLGYEATGGKEDFKYRSKL